MFDKLEDLVHRYEDLMFELQSPDVANYSLQKGKAGYRRFPFHA